METKLSGSVHCTLVSVGTCFVLHLASELPLMTVTAAGPAPRSGPTARLEAVELQHPRVLQCRTGHEESGKSHIDAGAQSAS